MAKNSNFKRWTRVLLGSKFFIRTIPNEDGTRIVSSIRVVPTNPPNIVKDLSSGKFVEVQIDSLHTYAIRVAVSFPLRSGSATIQAFLQDPNGVVRKAKYNYAVAFTDTSQAERATLVLHAIDGDV